MLVLTRLLLGTACKQAPPCFNNTLVYLHELHRVLLLQALGHGGWSTWCTEVGTSTQRATKGF